MSDQARDLRQSAQTARNAGDFETALRHQQAAVALYRDQGDVEALAHAIRHTADILTDAGRHEAAAPHYAEMIALYRDTAHADPLDLANAVRTLALHHENLGESAEAKALWAEAYDRYAALDGDAAGARDPGIREARAHLEKYE